MSLVTRLEKNLSRGVFRKTAYALSVAFLLIVVVGPTIHILTFMVKSWRETFTWIFSDPFLKEVGKGAQKWFMMRTALIRSFQIAAITTLVDVVAGLPMAVILARYEFKGKKFVDTLIDMPMAVPTAALGFSLYLFWGTMDGISGLLGLKTGLVSRGPILITLTHIAFTYPYIVRSLKEVIKSVDRTYEYAARTLGAPTFTVFRTITSPLIKGGLVAGSILAFTRSLGETGATLIVCGAFETAPVLVVSWRRMLMIPETAFLSMILVSIAVFLLALLRFSAERFGIPIRRIWPRPERLLSGKAQRRIRDFLTFLVFAILVFIPSLYIFTYMVKWWNGSPYSGVRELGVYYQVFLAPDDKWMSLWNSLVTSVKVATIATAVNIVAGLPIAFILARGRGRIQGLLDILIDIPLAVPTAALGFSFFLFWGAKGLRLLSPGFWLIVLVHIAFTYPYIVRPLVAVIQSLDPELEEAARTLGAPPLTVFRTVILPSIKPGILAASIMAFTRSLGETGATIVVMGLSRTVPVLIVQWVESLALPAASFACAILIVISYTLLLTLRYVVGWE